MSIRQCALLTLVALSAGWGLQAQDEAALMANMKATGEAFNKLRGLPAKTGDEAAGHATKLQETYDQMTAFFTQRNMEDAVTWSKEGKVAAADLTAAAKAGDAEKAAAATKVLGGTCRSCHDAHREKLPDGSYKIK